MKHPQNRTLPKIGTVDSYRHLWLLGVWLVYFGLFILAEHLVTENYWVSYLPLDDKIPFCEWFVLPYCTWHPLLAVFTLYLAFYDRDAFIHFMLFIGIGFIGTIVFCMLFPNGQDLRPASFAHENFCTWLLRRVYAADTNTNVIPSMHVIGCAAMTCACFESRPLRNHGLQWVMLPLGLLISISTVFVKQHSILDFFVAIPVSAAVAAAVYLPKWNWLRKLVC